MDSGISILKMVSLFLALLWITSVRAEGKPSLTIAGLSRGEALRFGERMYREGILPSGALMEAVIAGDVHVNGRMFACVSCHQRSGLGSFDGNIVSLPISGPKLYQPMSYIEALSKPAWEKMPKWMKRNTDFRPAYTDETLAAALRKGEDPLGRKFNEVMPIYSLTDRDMEIMIFYLKNLSVELSPGVSDTALRLATVVAEGVSKDDLEAMLIPLQFYTSTWGKSRDLQRRRDRGAYTEEEMNKGYRSLTLALWQLKGPPESWRQQLEGHYQKDPVFALVGGMTTHDWAPIHRFCEDHRIPSIFPITDLPVVSKTDWYTLYFSRGLYLEGEAAAKYINGMGLISKGVSTVQVFRNNQAGLALCKAFGETLQALGHPPPHNVVLDDKEIVTGAFWKQLFEHHEHSVVALWLDSKDLSVLKELTEIQKRPEMVFASSSLLGQGLYSLPEIVRNFVYITYPYRLPEEDKSYQATVKTWLRNNKIPVTNLTIQSKVYDLVMMLSSSMGMLGRSFYRDRLLELFDMMGDQWYSIALYPRFSFGQGQRYASKGCYIVQLTEGLQPALVKRSDWVMH
jgi:hypothetical protein